MDTIAPAAFAVAAVDVLVSHGLAADEVAWLAAYTQASGVALGADVDVVLVAFLDTLSAVVGTNVTPASGLAVDFEFGVATGWAAAAVVAAASAGLAAEVPAAVVALAGGPAPRP